MADDDDEDHEHLRRVERAHERLNAALHELPDVAEESMRATVMMVLAAHLAQLAETRDEWPKLSPSDALTDLSVGECSILDHVDAVADRLLARVGVTSSRRH